MTLDPKLVALGFKPVGSNKRRIFMTAEGEPATGKTKFIQGCPGPIAVLDFDFGMEGVAQFDSEGREIARFPIEMPDLDSMGSKTATPEERTLAINSYKKFKDVMSAVFKSGVVRTVAVDTGGAAYALAQIARFGQLAQLGEVPAASWTSMQAEYERIFLEYQASNCNLIVTHRIGSKFMGLKGEKELKGYKQMQHLAQVHLRFVKEYVRDEKGKPVGLKLYREVIKCRQRLALENPADPSHVFDVVFIDDQMEQSVGGDFLTVAQAVFPNSKPEEWV